MRIRTEGVSFAYDAATPALRGVDLEVDDGQSLALVGPNGSGKSTLLKILSGVLRPDGGAVLLDGTPLRALSARQIARRVGMVEQERSMGFDFTVREVVAMGRIPHRGRFARESAADRSAIDRAMDLSDVLRLGQRSIRAVSGGERQRVYLAMALAQRPDVLLLDEPTTHLDLRHQVQFMEIVRERARDGIAVLIAIHDLTLAAQASDRIALLREGQIVVAGAPDKVLTRSNVRRVFDVEALVGRHPERGTIYVLPTLVRRPQPSNAASPETDDHPGGSGICPT